MTQLRNLSVSIAHTVALCYPRRTALVLNTPSTFVRISNIYNDGLPFDEVP